MTDTRVSARSSARALAQRLAQIPVVIADPDLKIANLVRDVLKSVGFTNIKMAKDGEEVLEVLRNQQVDLLITDWRMERVDGVSLMRFLRTDPASPNRFLPIIMLTGKAEKKDVEVARDAGVTEYLVKPFTAKTLFERIVQIVENPRSFILAKGYKGPDRRRRAVDAVPPDERRIRRPRPGGKTPKVAD